jgi:phenylacetate-CoA ligase
MSFGPKRSRRRYDRAFGGKLASSINSAGRDICALAFWQVPALALKLNGQLPHYFRQNHFSAPVTLGIFAFMENAKVDLQKQFYDMLMRSQYWSPERMRDYQRSQLSQLLRHAKSNVPFYEKRLDAVLKPNGDIDWDRWEEIPIVKRVDMVEHRDAMQAKVLPPGHGQLSTIETSGSTGKRITLTLNSLVAIPNNAFRWRAHRWNDLDWSKSLCTRMGSVDTSDEWPRGEPIGLWGPYFDSHARQGGTWQIDRFAPSERVFEIIRRNECRYLNAGPDMAHVNALDALRLGVEIRLDAILCQGNIVRQSDRDICQKAFGAKLIEHYSSKEGGQMAHPCAQGSLHINVEGALVEIVDESGHPCAFGEAGRVVVTPFYLTAQPLIRYDQGDIAVVGRPCSCGRHSPTIASIQGRSTSVFRHPDGRALSAEFPDEIEELLQSEHWQLAQVGPLAYELRYKRKPNAQIDSAAVKELFELTFFPDADLTFIQKTELGQHSMKLSKYINEWSNASTGAPN